MPARGRDVSVEGMSPDIPIPGVTVSTAPSSTSPTVVAPDRADRSPRRLAVLLLFALFVIAVVARSVFLAWEPPFTGALEYDVIAPLGSAYWTMNLFVGGPSFVVTWVALAILVALLANGRSAPVTLAAALLIGLGGTVFALAVTSEVFPFALAARTENVAEADGRALFDVLNADLGLLVPTILTTQGLVAFGVLVVLIVALVTRVLPRWMSLAGLLYLVAFVVVPFDLLPRPVTVASDLVQSLLVLGIGWYGFREGIAGHAARH